MKNSIRQMVLEAYPQPIAICFKNYIHEQDSYKKYKKMLNLFEITLRFLSTIALLNYIYYSESKEKINNIISEHLHRSDSNHWHNILTEVLLRETSMLGDFFAPELMRFCHKNLDNCAELSTMISDFLVLLSPDYYQLELAETEFPDLLDQFSPKILWFLEQVSFLQQFPLVRYVEGGDEGVYQLEMYSGLTHKNMTHKVKDSEDLNIDHLFLFDLKRKKLLDLFPLLLYRRCEHCLGKHFFLFNGVRDNKTMQYIDFDSNHNLIYQNIDALCEFGNLYLKKSLYTNAIEFFNHALDHDPHSESARSKKLFCHEKLGNYYYQNANYYRSLREYEAALRIDPDNARVLFNLSLAYKKIKEYDQALSALNRLVKNYPNYQRAYEILGYLYEETGNYAKALFYYNRFLKIEPDHQGVNERRLYVIKKVEQGMKDQKGLKSGQADDKSMSFEDMVTDLTREALQDKFKPIIGRENEINEICQVLCCMKKNNPLIVGEPGVGKTSIVEELSRRIVHDDVPVYLSNRRILQLRATTLLAGTKYRGQFEERMLLLISELKKRKNSILFIDDIHTIMNAGLTKGSSVDASNALKPELAKGQIQIIGICTYDEYRLYLEKDPAFERRFQKIKINEPDSDKCIAILKSVKEQFEQFHNVMIDDSALKTVVELPRVYLRDRYLPDKAIDLLDRTCAIVATENTQTGTKGERYIPHVTEESIVHAVSQLTRIPIAKIAHAHSQRFLEMENELKKRIIGQTEAINVVSEVIRTTKMDFDINPMRPDGVFLFVGPTGVGKTELARAMAEFLFGDEEKMLRIDMSEFTDDISTSKLIGITPGYVGYNDRNQLTDHVRNYPYSLILLDEVEKANRQVLNLFLQVFDSGRLTDGRGRTVYFNNATFVMTSNIGADLFSRSKVGYGAPNMINEQEVFHRNVSKGELRKAVATTFPPEFINRIDEIVFFRALSKDDVKDIANLQLSIIHQKLRNEGKQLVLSDEALDFIVERGYSEQFGARNLARCIRKLLLDPLALKSLQPEWKKTVEIAVDALDEELKIE